jgi:hypothetical protein
MKKSLFLLISIVLFSCSKNDDNSSSATLTPTFNSQDLIGKWDLKSSVTGTTNNPLDSCEQLHSGYEFKVNNICIEGYGRINPAGTCTNNQYNQTYTLTNNIITVKQTNGYEARYNITELSTTKLKLTLIYSKEVYNGNVYENNPPVGQQTTSSYDKI